ncbi:unnamed protein product [Polarella glacialis]|uniref:F-box domain-containing protein n=1 Tax=Polarella glacialis TaxID=89957 RepID=A0A813JCT4_POLGL|nr:unnamed protein product [Polarella glacialis]CAE8671569.1 unnamed protein product [Polarella glacialis]
MEWLPETQGLCDRLLASVSCSGLASLAASSRSWAAAVRADVSWQAVLRALPVSEYRFCAPQGLTSSGLCVLLALSSPWTSHSRCKHLPYGPQTWRLFRKEVPQGSVVAADGCSLPRGRFCILTELHGGLLLQLSWRALLRQPEWIHRAASGSQFGGGDFSAAAYPERWCRDRKLAACLQVDGEVDCSPQGERQVQLRAFCVTDDGCLVLYSHHLLFTASGAQMASHGGFAVVGSSGAALHAWCRGHPMLLPAELADPSFGHLVTELAAEQQQQEEPPPLVGRGCIEWVALRSCQGLLGELDAMLADQSLTEN